MAVQIVLLAVFTTNQGEIAMNNQSSNSVANSELECNYADNYYGDQVCVLKRS